MFYRIAIQTQFTKFTTARNRAFSSKVKGIFLEFCQIFQNSFCIKKVQVTTGDIKFEKISHIVVFLSMTLNMYLPAGLLILFRTCQLQGFMLKRNYRQSCSLKVKSFIKLARILLVVSVAFWFITIARFIATLLFYCKETCRK